jgi:hypothetical protein
MTTTKKTTTTRKKATTTTTAKPTRLLNQFQTFQQIPLCLKYLILFQSREANAKKVEALEKV